MRLTKAKVEEIFESSKEVIYNRVDALELPYSEDFETFHTESVATFKGKDEYFCSIRSRGALTVEYGSSEEGIDRYFIIVTGNHKGLRVVTMFSVDKLD